jgi:hypothetical protein
MCPLLEKFIFFSVLEITDEEEEVEEEDPTE